MDSNSHNGDAGHRVLVSFAIGDRDDLMYLQYRCEDPTCEWCVVEYGEDDCKGFANIIDNLLTHEIRDVKTQRRGGEARSGKESSQTNLFGPEECK